jgi:hypothetical protein
MGAWFASSLSASAAEPEWRRVRQPAGEADDRADRFATAMARCWTGIRVPDTAGLGHRSAMASAVTGLTSPVLLTPPLGEAAAIDVVLAVKRFRPLYSGGAARD